MNRTYIFILIMLALVSNARGQNLEKSNENEELTLDPAVRYGKLDNGFTYYISKNDSPANTVQLHMIVKAGSYHEDEDQNGYAHLLEHMGNKGTKNFPVVDNYFKTAGRYTHANTSYDHTRYWARIPSGDKEVLQSGLQIVRDWAQDILLGQNSVDVERGAIFGEMRTRDPYRRWLREAIEEKIVENTGFKYNHLEVEKANLENFNRKAFLRYYDQWYRPDLQTAIIVGDVDVDSVEIAVRQMFSDLKMPKKPKNAQKRVEAQRVELSGETRFFTILDTVHPDLRLNIIFNRPNHAYNIQTKEDYEEMLLQKIYKTIIAQKSEQLERQYNSPFSHFSVNYRAGVIAAGQISSTLIALDLEPANIEQMRQRFFRALISWKRMHKGITNEDLEEAKSIIYNKYSNFDARKSESLARRYEDHFIKGTAAPDPEVERRLVEDVLKEITLEETRNFFNTNENFKESTDFIFLKGKEETKPDYSAFKKWLAEVDTMKVQPLESPPPPITSLEEVAKIPAANEKEIRASSENAIGVSTIRLSNGISLVLKPSDPRNDDFANSISIDAFRPNKISIDDRRKYLAGSVFPEVLQFTGAGDYNKFELERFEENEGLRLRFITDKDFQQIHGKGKTKAIDELIDLIYLYVSRPRKDSLGFAAWKRYQEKQLKGEGLRGSTEFVMDDIHALWYPEVPKLQHKDLNHLSMEKVFLAGDQWFSDFKDFTFIISGDFDKEDLERKLIKKLSAFPVRNGSSGEKEKLNFPFQKMDETIRKKNLDQAIVRLYFPVIATRDVKTKVEMRILEKALHQRIWDRLRVGSYAPRVSGKWMDIKNEIYAIFIAFDSELGNEEKMIAYALEEYQKLREKGVEREWLEKAIADEVAAYESRLTSFAFVNFWPGYLQTKLENDEDLATEILQYGTLMEHFTSLEDINAAAKKYLTEENLQKFVVLPEGYQPVNEVE